MSRLSWDSYFMALVKTAAMRSGCNSRPNGALIVKNKRIVGVGYNGTVAGFPQCTDKGDKYCFRRNLELPESEKHNYCPAVHAEANAIDYAGKNTIGATIYCTLFPCYPCLKRIKSAGIIEIVYEYAYESENPERDKFWFDQAKEFGIDVRQYSIPVDIVETICINLRTITAKRRI